MPDSETLKHRPTCMLAHNLVDKLSVIIGTCDLVLGFDGVSKLEDPALRRRLEVIRSTAATLAKDVSGHACQLDSAIRAMRSADSPTQSVESLRDDGSRVEVRKVDRNADPLQTDGNCDQRRVRPNGITLAHMAKRVGK